MNPMGRNELTSTIYQNRSNFPNPNQEKDLQPLPRLTALDQLLLSEVLFVPVTEKFATMLVS